MIEFVEGKIDQINPTSVVINTGGLGYFINISIYAYEVLQGQDSARVLTHLSIKEDSHTLYGFHHPMEREVFRHLISVSGVGTATARVIISSLTHEEVIQAILNGNVPLLKSIKGIGPKAAQRLILELQDKLGKMEVHPSMNLGQSTSKQQEAVDALLALGFARSAAEKAVVKVQKESEPNASAEELIKKSLKLL
jgi:Holliday junction DNA helicase RuvA